MNMLEFSPAEISGNQSMNSYFCNQGGEFSSFDSSTYIILITTLTFLFTILTYIYSTALYFNL
jgi:hypothetical protein